ncbi:2-amino-4-hydroxy-6-hydroxymethyldihydropteridine diphosphokinase [Candidatus Peregrinibacteria bacterium]|nr:2-amino-4-hydroxy-6-hydroxymethyldihydropteridine diphosphokinase [Candidatus Peregrinibacteria bacterium]
MTQNSHIFLSLGSNVGNREEYVQKAILSIGKLGNILHISSLWETLPWGEKDQDRFLNLVLEMETSHAPQQFLQEILTIEKKLGRKRTKKWGPREIDIDILFWNNEIIATKDLSIPHPFAHMRAFVVAPLLEICPKYNFPNGVSAKKYWNNLSDEEKKSVEKYAALK